MKIVSVCMMFLSVVSVAFSQEEDPTLLKVKVIDSRTNEPITAQIDLYLNNDMEEYHTAAASNGEWSKPLTEYGWYLIDITAGGYLTRNDTLWITNSNRTTIVRDYYLTPVEPGLRFTYNNIHFHFGTSYLRKESLEVLQTFIKILEDNPAITIEIAGHSDDEGPDDYNLSLSQERAESIAAFMVNAGIDKSRLTARGYGETKPVDPGITKAAKARNRRVEFVVTAIDCAVQ